MTGSWTFFGAGNMASSLVGGLLGQQPHAKVTMIDPNQQARQRAQSRFGVATGAALDHIEPGEAVIIAVKPDKVRGVCLQLADLMKSDDNQANALIVSVAAGVRASAMQGWLPKGTSVIRCMPNTPALLGLGASALFANASSTSDQCARAEALLNASGMVTWVSDECLLDTVTALSGSGPAYFFTLVELMAQSAEALGLAPEVAQNLAIETAYGAASMLRAREDTPGVLREKVTSKGGTTAAALQAFEQGDLAGLVDTAMRAAHHRAKQMGDEFAPVHNAGERH